MKILAILITMILGLATVQAQDSFESALRTHVKELTANKYMGR